MQQGEDNIDIICMLYLIDLLKVPLFFQLIQCMRQHYRGIQSAQSYTNLFNGTEHAEHLLAHFRYRKCKVNIITTI